MVLGEGALPLTDVLCEFGVAGGFCPGVCFYGDQGCRFESEDSQLSLGIALEQSYCEPSFPHLASRLCDLHAGLQWVGHMFDWELG